MTLVGAILKKLHSEDSVKKNNSPPPEIDESVLEKKKKKVVEKFSSVTPVVDTSAPRYHAARMLRSLQRWTTHANALYLENLQLLCAIAKAMSGGKVDSHWSIQPPGSKQFGENRRNACKLINKQNRHIYTRIRNTGPRIVPTARLREQWARNKQIIVQRARRQFILFPLSTPELMEDLAFRAPRGVQRPRVHLSLQVHGAAPLGALLIELFPDVCPRACRLFLDLLDGDGLGHGYVGTCFFRKVPHLFWSGGDVIHDNGFGCYAQRGRARPVLAENYHFSHSMPGLVSLRTTRAGELCGSFNITFKPLPQFDLNNVVFGRVIRPCSTYDVISTLGSALSSRPRIEVASTRRWDEQQQRWVTGAPNTRLTTARKTSH